jgi:hypothetical protein
MLVYGDPQFRASPRVFARCLRQLIIRTPLDDLDGLRAVLIQAGQLEQGVADTPDASADLRLCMSLTETLARGFIRGWSLTQAAAAATGAAFSSETKEASRFASGIAYHRPLTVKIPEGFAFYALFPEQYRVAAARWARARAGCRPREVLVVGIRSIGTTLSAIVKATLEELGWKAERVTVRLSGAPFARQLASPKLPRLSRLLVVDEGPGLSGSSMAAVARAAAGAGATDIAFLPGHAGEPGPAASPEVRGWWQRVPRYFMPLEQMRWNGRCLVELLQHDTVRKPAESQIGSAGRLSAHTDATVDLSAGAWRNLAFSSQTRWPAVTAAFERMKLLCRAGSGPVLWKFAGLGCARDAGAPAADLTLKTIEAKTGAIQSQTPLRMVHGFAAMPWVKGRRLVRADVRSPGTLNTLAAFIAGLHGPVLGVEESEAATKRLAEMLYWNTREALGETFADQARVATERVLIPAPEEESYADGRMAPWEWVRTPSGALIKTDVAGHAHDHTLIGPQPILWDVAGALVEWDLQPKQRDRLLAALHLRGLTTKPCRLAVYEMAYAAFRVGIISAAAVQGPGDEREEERLERARAFYRQRLSGAIRACPKP